MGLYAHRVRRRLRNHQARAAQAADARRCLVRGAFGTHQPAVVRLAGRQHRPAADVHHGRAVHDRVCVPAVLDAREQERRADFHRHHDRDEFRPRHDVRTRILLFSELFGPTVRYSGASFGFQASAAIGGGFAPIIATAMVGYFGGTTGVSIMMIVLALITLAAALAARETKGGSLL